MIKSTSRIIATLVALTFAAACGGPVKPPPPPTPPPPSVEPDWATSPPKGCAASSSEDVGSRKLARKTAIGDARDELSRQLATRVEGMFKSYLAGGKYKGKPWSEEETKTVTRQVVALNIKGSRTVKTQIVGKHMYALVCLDLQTFAGALDRMEKGDDEMRAALKKRSDAEYRDLDKQVDKIKKQK